jgi:hypothetical protein
MTTHHGLPPAVDLDEREVLRQQANHLYFEALRGLDHEPTPQERRAIFKRSVRQVVQETHPRLPGRELDVLCNELQAFIGRRKSHKSIPPQQRPDFGPKILALAERAEDLWAARRDALGSPASRKEQKQRFLRVVEDVLDEQAKLPAPRGITKRALVEKLKTRAQARAASKSEREEE